MDAAYKRRIEQLYLQMGSRLFVYARSILGSESLAEEAVQETFRIACMKPEALCTSENPEGWLVNTLKNTISNIKRSRIAATIILSRYIACQGGTAPAAQDSMAPELIYADIAELEEFKLIREMAIEGRSHLEMARSRGISVDACKKRVERAKKTLQKKIGQ